MYKEWTQEEFEQIEVGERENTEQFRLEYLTYRYFLTEYLIKKLALKEFDEEISNSGLDFSTVKEASMDIYQFFSSSILQFFYIRNDLYLNRLTESEKEFLRKRVQNRKVVIDDEILSFIERTYQKVIFKDVFHNGTSCMAFYGPENLNFSAPNNAVVVGFRYDEFDMRGLRDEEWQDIYDKQTYFLYSLLKRMNEELKTKLEVPVTVIQYNDFSIRYRPSYQGDHFSK